MYSIGPAAEMFAFPVSTLRYSDKHGLFPNTERVSGIRKSGETEIEALRATECTKKPRTTRASAGALFNALAAQTECCDQRSSDTLLQSDCALKGVL